jgi:predicted tellurium resistance membrane protein TerC
MELLTMENLAALLALTGLEIVLGIDNIVFIALVTSRLPIKNQASARRWGLLLAMGTRILLLFALKWTMSLVAPLFSLWGHAFSGRDVILFLGGLFLLVKSTKEIHKLTEHREEAPHLKGKKASYLGVLFEIALLDVIFSLDSVITAVGMAREIVIMVIAIVVAILVMVAFSNLICDFIETHPTLKMLALSFLLMVGVMLIVEGMGKHIEKGYLYFAMAFSLGVEILNIRAQKNKNRTEKAI